MQGDEGSSGWDAINAALAVVYPAQEPQHFGATLPWTLGGRDPLDGVSVYWNQAPRPHWHFVTYGFSELFAKQSDDPALSGFGFELTFRLAAGPEATAGDRPPTWPMSLLQNLARYVFQTGNVFEPGHYMNANGPIALDHATELAHLAFMRDPQLPPRATPNGALQFLQVIGLVDAEMAAIKRWSTDGVMQVLESAMPLWITDLARGSLLADPALAAQVEAGSRRDGSSTAALMLETLEAHRDRSDGPTVLVLGAGQVASVLDLLAARLPYGRALDLVGDPLQWTFVAGQEDTVAGHGQHLRCSLAPASLQRLTDTLRPVRGTYPVSAALCVEVRPTCLRDAQGEVVRWIG